MFELFLQFCFVFKQIVDSFTSLQKLFRLGFKFSNEQILLMIISSDVSFESVRQHMILGSQINKSVLNSKNIYIQIEISHFQSLVVLMIDRLKIKYFFVEPVLLCISSGHSLELISSVLEFPSHL